MIITCHSGDEILSVDAHAAPKRDRVDMGAALHAYNRARDYAERMTSYRTRSVKTDRLEVFASAMDDFLVFCLFCRRYMELIPNSQLRGHSLDVIEVPSDKAHFGSSDGGTKTRKNMKTVVERVLHCIFHYPLYGTHPNGSAIIAGCEVKSDRDQVYQLQFDDFVDAFLGHVPSELEKQQADYLVQDRAERDKMIAEHKQRGHA